MDKKITILIGLGNPGTDYANSYHNAGSLFIDHLAAEGSAKFKKNRLFEYAEIKLGDRRCLLIKTLVFMNLAGEAVLAVIKYFGVKPENILVIHDDSDVETGKYKLSFGRGAAGHKGAESVIKKLGGKDFNRLRIGIREMPKPGRARAKAGKFVLKNITGKDKTRLYSTFNAIKRNVIENDTLSPAVCVIEEIGN